MWTLNPYNTIRVCVFFYKLNDEIAKCIRSCRKSVESLTYLMQHSIHNSTYMTCTITLLVHKNGTVAVRWNDLTHSCAFHSLCEVTFFGTWSWIFSFQDSGWHTGKLFTIFSIYRFFLRLLLCFKTILTPKILTRSLNVI